MTPTEMGFVSDQSRPHHSRPAGCRSLVADIHNASQVHAALGDARLGIWYGYLTRFLIPLVISDGKLDVI
jgi:hypothetical protein